MGCGTGILAIFTSIKGAANLVAIDTEEWAAENTRENVARNKINNIDVLWGDKKMLPQIKFDSIFANINLNILKQDIPTYSQHLTANGKLFLSGFFTTELPQIIAVCEANGLFFVSQKNKNEWVACEFMRI
jgi:ribosomal protein L11 methyltransferase